MVLDPQNSAIDRVRLRISDIEDVPFLTDEVIQYYLTKNVENEALASKECATVILGILARNATYNKIDSYIVDGAKAYTSYRDYLLLLIKNPAISDATITVYAGGISKSDMQANNDNLDNNVRPSFKTVDVGYTDQYTIVRW